MKTWRRYEKYLLSGEWHVHTSYTDGSCDVLELCQRAIDRGIPLLAITEHVRKNISYDFDRLLDDIESARQEYPQLIILSGAEAKVLPDGTLDVADEVLEKVDYPAFSFHGFPRDKDLYLECLNSSISHYRVNAWCHPCEFLRKTGIALNDIELCRIFRLMKEKDVLLELNGRYGLPEKSWIAKAREIGVRFVTGSDIHDAGDFSRRNRTW